MNTKYDLPMMMSAKDLQSMGFSRSMAYRLLQGDLMPVVCIGNRKFIRHETLLKWLAEQEQMNTTVTQPVAGNIPEDNSTKCEDDYPQLTFDNLKEEYDHENTC